MSPSTPPPDMTREQRRELKELNRRFGQIEAGINKEGRSLARQVSELEALFAREERRINTAARKELAAIERGVRSEQRKLRLQIARIHEGRTPDFKTRAAIAKRIAILEGRQGS